MKIEKTKRHTIMDGRVVTYAPRFHKIDGVFGNDYNARGSFEISVSRDKILVHKCEVTNEQELLEFFGAFKEAEKQFKYLKQTNGRPVDKWDGSPIKIHLKNIRSG